MGAGGCIRRLSSAGGSTTLVVRHPRPSPPAYCCASASSRGAPAVGAAEADQAGADSRGPLLLPPRRPALAKPQELAIDVGIAAGFLGFQWNRGGKFAACIPCGFSIDPMVYYTSWSHLVATLDFTTGDAAYYVNGTLLRKVPGEKQEAIFRTVPRPGGHILVGMGLAPSSVAWDVNQLSSAAMDDMRIHNRVLSADEVKAGAWKHPHQLPKSYTDSLVLHWGFDDPNGDTELDLSGRGRDGIRGAVDNVPGGRVSYKDSLTPVSKPRPVMGPVREPGPFNISTFVLLGEESQLHSRGTGASGPIQLVSLPETGQLLLSGSAAAAVGQDVSGAELLYRAPEQWPGSEEAPVEFRYQTGGVLYSARIYLARPCAAPNRAVAATSWENVTLLLGGICGDGRHVDTEILGPPTMGTIRAFVPGKQMWPLNFPLLVSLFLSVTCVLMSAFVMSCGCRTRPGRPG